MRAHLALAAADLSVLLYTSIGQRILHVDVVLVLGVAIVSSRLLRLRALSLSHVADHSGTLLLAPCLYGKTTANAVGSTQHGTRIQSGGCQTQ